MKEPVEKEKRSGVSNRIVGRGVQKRINVRIRSMVLARDGFLDASNVAFVGFEGWNVVKALVEIKDGSIVGI